MHSHVRVYAFNACINTCESKKDRMIQSRQQVIDNECVFESWSPPASCNLRRTQSWTRCTNWGQQLTNHTCKHMESRSLPIQRLANQTIKTRAPHPGHIRRHQISCLQGRRATLEMKIAPLKLDEVSSLLLLILGLPTRSRACQTLLELRFSPGCIASRKGENLGRRSGSSQHKSTTLDAGADKRQYTISSHIQKERWSARACLARGTRMTSVS